MEPFDIAILGGGTGGYTAAIRAAHLGARTVLIENRELGGTCLNRGCIPTKSIIASIEAMEHAKKGGVFGFRAEGVEPDLRRLMDRKKQVVSRLVKGVEQLLKGNRVDVVFGRGELISENEIRAVEPDGRERTIRARRIVLAAGSEPARLPRFRMDGKSVLTSDEALKMESVPRSLLIVGAGAIGVEFARIFHSLGSKVVVAEMENQVLPGMDGRLAQVLSSKMRKNGIDVKTGSAIQDLRTEDGGVLAAFCNGETVRTEKVLVSIGRMPNSTGIGLEKVGVATEKGFVRTDSKMATSVPGLYAVGDLAGKWLLAYTAAQEGIAAAENALGRNKDMDYRCVPVTVFSDPEIASVGLSEKEALEKGIDVAVGRFLFAANGKALVLDETDGFVSVVADKKTGEMLGGQIAGPRASDLIAEMALAVGMHLRAGDLARTLHSHPTLAEAVSEAAHDVTGESVQKLRKS